MKRLLWLLPLLTRICLAVEKDEPANPTLVLQLKVQKIAFESRTTDQLSKELTDIGLPPISVEKDMVKLRLETAWSARDLAMAWAWRKPHAVSADAHQGSWEVRTQTRATKVTRKSALLFESPQLGPWVVEAQLAGRPSGKQLQPKLGSYLAYDLAQNDGTVQALTFRRLAKKN